MKKGTSLLVATISCFVSASFDTAYSQDDTDSKFKVGADFYSNYIWRGSNYGTGPVIQPSAKYSGKILTAGAWASTDLNGFQEADLFLSFALPAGFSAGLTDYYFSGLEYFDYSSASGCHAYEINLGFAKAGFSLSGNYIINEAGGAGSLGGDTYLQAGYSFSYFNVFLGAGDGWHTFNPDTGEDKFAVCNLGIGVLKSIKVTETFNIPVTGQVILNPDKEQMFIVVGFTF
ncbi:MAG: hypothetical protein A2X04_05315 [Bacteroidetes bacterium GWF2_41_9]|nr:MAG: hypothetical protein A2X06_18120 [Bacteroidetes bacterium GWC2_40_22]OFY58023.1 MAG: hypothetical protein A2X04_05315 [Bacteroidetes bacterium GWF2_41_9]